jgi:hypothetical protein
VTDDELKSLFEAMRQESAAIRHEMREETAAIRHETAAIRHEMREETTAIRQENAAAHAETRHLFVMALEAFEHKIQLVAEGVALTREELARAAAGLDEKIERTAAETQAMIKFSHAELDRRMRTLEGTQRTLEEGLAGLQARVERLESTTH